MQESACQVVNKCTSGTFVPLRIRPFLPYSEHPPGGREMFARQPSGACSSSALNSLQQPYWRLVHVVLSSRCPDHRFSKTASARATGGSIFSYRPSPSSRCC